MPFTQFCIVKTCKRNLDLIFQHTRHSDPDVAVSKALDITKRISSHVGITDKKCYQIGFSQGFEQNGK